MKADVGAIEDMRIAKYAGLRGGWQLETCICLPQDYLWDGSTRSARRRVSRAEESDRLAVRQVKAQNANTACFEWAAVGGGGVK